MSVSPFSGNKKPPAVQEVEGEREEALAVR
jgi:hypothetical protein